LFPLKKDNKLKVSTLTIIQMRWSYYIPKSQNFKNVEHNSDSPTEYFNFTSTKYRPCSTSWRICFKLVLAGDIIIQ